MALDINEIKKVGTLQQRDKQYFILRLRLVAGDADAHFLETVARVAKEFGRGEVHLTTRQGIEIPWVPVEKVLEARQALTDGGLKMGVSGPRVRVVVGCPGSTVCRWGIIDTKKVAARLDADHFGREMPHKFKFAVTGCPHNCAKATENDLGVMGGIEPGWEPESCTDCGLCLNICPVNAITRDDQGQYAVDQEKCIHCPLCTASCPQDSRKVKKQGSIVWVGGTMGKVPRLATKLTGIVDDEGELHRIVARTLDFFAQNGRKKERFGPCLDRFGVEAARQEILGKK